MSRADRVEGVVTAAGTGAVTLDATPPVGRQGLSAIGANATTFTYSLEQGANWEIGTGTITGTNTFTRVPVKSSNGGAVVSFTAGAKFYNTIRAGEFDAFLTSANGVTLETYLVANPGSTPASSYTIPIIEGNALKGVTMNSVADYINSTYPTGKSAVLTISTTSAFPLDFAVHNRRRLLCTVAANITGPGSFGSVGNDFSCQVTNVSGSAVTFGAGITCIPSGTTVPVGTTADVFSAGGVLYAQLPTASTPAVIPGQVTSLTMGTPAASTVPATWAAPTIGTTPFTYTTQYRAVGAGAWTTAATGVSATSYTYTGLIASTNYEFQVLATNGAGSGTPSATATATTAVGPSVPNQGVAPTVGPTTATTAPLTWTAPPAGSAPTSYNVEYRIVGAGSFTTFATGVTSLSSTVTGLTAATNYEFRITPVNAAGTGAASPVSAGTTAAAPVVTVSMANFNSGFPATINSFSGNTWFHTLSMSGATASTMEYALIESATAYPSSALDGTTTPRGKKSAATKNGSNAAVWESASNMALGFNVSNTATPFYFWIKLTDTSGAVYYFRRTDPVQISDNGTLTGVGSIINVPRAYPT